MASKYDQLKERMKNSAKRVREGAEATRMAVETVATAGALGYSRGRGWGGEKFSIGPVPIDLAVGLVGIGAAMYGGRGGSDAMAVGVGGLSSYIDRKAFAMGEAAKLEAGKKTEGRPRSGVRHLPPRSQAPVSPYRQQATVSR